MAADTMNANGGSPVRTGADAARLADAVVTACGLGTVLDIGSGAGRLTEALLRHGLDARGLELQEALVADADARMPGRFVQGDVRAMPFGDGEFEVVVSNGCLECMDGDGVHAALAEIRRVCTRYVILRLDVSKRVEDGLLRTRDWWERKFFASGFRKHPRYYRLNPYESLNHEGNHILVAFERLSDEALAAYPLSALEEECGLHMDMLRDTGERSDAHVIRYQWACNFIRPYDRVLDAACGLGYGGHVVRALTRAASVTGIDGSEYAVDYANLCYGSSDRGSYVCGYLPQALSAYPDASFDAVISFETLEHVDDPQALLREFHRVLTPGGRVIVSVPNDWSDESGEDPNPYHLQVYDLDRLRTEIAKDFDVEAAYVQSASQAKVVGQKFVWERKQRELYPVDPQTREQWSAEWWLMVGIKSPFSEAEYRERVFANVAPSGHPSVRYAEEYENPWLGLSMITIGQRASLPALRERYASTVLQQASPASADYGAALCVMAYILLGSTLPSSARVEALLGQIDRYLETPGEGWKMVLRWRVSLAYVKAEILRAQGRFEEALSAFIACAGIEASNFGVHLLTKTTAAWFEAGKLAVSLGRLQQARQLWMQGLDVGRRLLSVRLEDVLLLPEYPNLFNHGDGIREYALAWDNLARCANGIHLLASGGEIDVRALDASFASEYKIVTRDLINTREQLRERDTALGSLRTELHDRTQRLELTIADLLDRTNDLVDTRAQLVERTRLLEASNALLARTQAELVDTRELLTERTEALSLAARQLIDRTERLESALAELAELRQAPKSPE